MRIKTGIVLFLAMNPAFAQLLSGSPPETPIVVIRDHDTYRIEPDGRFTNEVDDIKLVKTAKGIQTAGQVQIPYSDSMQSIEVLEAYTETPDGKKIPVEKDKILTQESQVSAQAPMFSDFKVKAIVFPQVEIGSKVHYRYVLTQKTPLFPGQFSVIESVQTDVQVDDSKVTVVAPKDLKLYTQAIDYTAGTADCPAADAGKQCLVWTAKNPKMQPADPLSVSALDYAPRLAISTFKDYAAVAAAYAARAAEKSKVTPKVQALADELTHGIAGKDKQAQALYDWVAKNVRYVAVYLGAGTVVPHDADTVIANRYGDCKDHVALLEALLAAKGIDSSGALINLGTTYWLPDVATAPGVFNHIITYIPGLHRYVDSTLQLARFGDLPISELGKPVLDVKVVDGKKQLDTIALPPASATHGEVVVKMKMQPDGTVSGTAKVRETGAADILGRTILANLPEGRESAAATQLLALSGQTGSGNIEKGDPRDISKPYEYGTMFDLPGLVHLPGPGAFSVPTGFHSMSTIASLGLITAKPEHKFALAGCADYSRREDYTLELPNDLKVTSVPKNVEIKTAIGTYQSVYDLKGQTLHVVRELSVTPGTATCSPDQYKDLRAFALDIGKDLRAQVLYQ